MTEWDKRWLKMKKHENEINAETEKERNIDRQASRQIDR